MHVVLVPKMKEIKNCFVQEESVKVVSFAFPKDVWSIDEIKYVFQVYGKNIVFYSISVV
jgi:hypothetical protein